MPGLVPGIHVFFLQSAGADLAKDVIRHRATLHRKSMRQYKGK